MTPNNQTVCTVTNPSDIYSDTEDLTELFEGTHNAAYIGDNEIPIGIDTENNCIVVIDLDCTSEESRKAKELCERFASGGCSRGTGSSDYLVFVDGRSYTVNYWH